MSTWVDKLNYYGQKRRPVLFIIAYDKSKALIFSPDEAKNADVLYNLPFFPRHKSSSFSGDICFHATPVPFERYLKAFKKVKHEFIRGNTFLLNLTFPTKIHSNMSLKEIFYHTDAPYRLYVPGLFTLFSPESFIRIENNKIASFPMKGTADAGETDAKRRLLDDSKELAEHTAIVDLIRNDLSMVSKNVTVPRFRYVEKFHAMNKELLQTSSEVRGLLEPHWNERLGEIFDRLLPAGSISGAPKKKTLDIIRHVEGYERGFFSGVFGFFDGKRVDSGVMIRFVERSGEDLLFKSGGGLMIYSDPEKEYKELIQKVYLPIKMSADRIGQASVTFCKS